MKCLIATLSVAIASAIFMPHLTSAQVVNLPSRRLNVGVQEQVTGGGGWDWHYVQGGFSWGDSDADNVLAAEAAGDELRGSSCIVVSEGTGESWCNTAIGNTALLPEVNTEGTVEASVHKGGTQAGGSAYSEWAGTAEAQFQIERHPTVDTEGSENDAPVMLEGTFLLFMNGGITGSLADFSYGIANMRVDESFVEAEYLYGVGWILNGELAQSSPADPNADPLVLTDVILGGGMDASLDFSQDSAIGNQIAVEATMEHFSGGASSTTGQAAGTHAILASYVLAAYYSVLDEQF